MKSNGIIERIKSAPTERETLSLLNTAKGWSEISPKTLRRCERVAQERIRQLIKP